MIVLEAQGWGTGRKQAAEAPKSVHTLYQTHTGQWSDKTCTKSKKRQTEKPTRT